MVYGCLVCIPDEGLVGAGGMLWGPLSRLCLICSTQQQPRLAHLTHACNSRVVSLVAAHTLADALWGAYVPVDSSHALPT